MFKRMNALLLSVSLLSAQFIAVHAEKPNEIQALPNTSSTAEYSTDKFIIDVKPDTEISNFSTKEENISNEDIEVAVNGVLSDLEVLSDNVAVSQWILLKITVGLLLYRKK